MAGAQRTALSVGGAAAAFRGAPVAGQPGLCQRHHQRTDLERRDQDGAFDGSESYVDGITILVDTNGDTVPEHTTVSSGGGFYAFDIRAAGPFGTYRVRQQVPSNRLASTTETKVCVMPNGESCENQDFGSFLSVQISGMTWDDLNGNGRRVR
jgi:hypothetical protein